MEINLRTNTKIIGMPIKDDFHSTCTHTWVSMFEKNREINKFNFSHPQAHLSLLACISTWIKRDYWSGLESYTIVVKIEEVVSNLIKTIYWLADISLGMNLSEINLIKTWIKTWKALKEYLCFKVDEKNSFKMIVKSSSLLSPSLRVS